MDGKRRRAIFERARERAISFGMEMESDPLFVGWIEEWIAGDIDVEELNSRYSPLLNRRSGERRLGVNVPKPATLARAAADDEPANEIPDPSSRSRLGPRSDTEFFDQPKLNS